MQDAAHRIGQGILISKAGTDRKLDPTFAAFIEQRIEALLVCSDPFFDTRRNRIITFATQSRIPAIYQFREYAVAGGLMSYGISLTEGYRQVGIYAGQILKGAKPAELPIEQPKKFELIINLKAAKQIGLTIPPNVLARADRVIR